MNCHERRRERNLLLVVSCLGSLSMVVRCRKEDPKPVAAPTASASAIAPASVIAPASKTAPWHEGAWSGGYEAEVAQIGLSAGKGGPKEPDPDDGKALVGKGNLQLTIAEDHRVSGMCTGSLGPLRASGELDGETLRVWLAPEAGNGAGVTCRGALVATRHGERFEGTVRTSTIDSWRPRVASVTLSKAKPANPVVAPIPSDRP